VISPISGQSLAPDTAIGYARSSMKSLYSLVALVTLAVGLPCLAQSDAPPPGQGQQHVSELARGFFIGATLGPSFILKAPALDGRKKPFAPGQMVKIDLGYDLGERLSLSAFVMAAQYRAGSDYLGEGTGQLSGDFSALTPGASLQLNAIGFGDDQGTQRTWIYLRGGAGYQIYFPKALLPNAELLAFVGPGVEYFTHLRHFSIGLEVMGSYLAKSGAFGFWVAPNVRYAF
jgi:hypothetical protein